MSAVGKTWHWNRGKWYILRIIKYDHESLQDLKKCLNVFQHLTEKTQFRVQLNKISKNHQEDGCYKSCYQHLLNHIKSINRSRLLCLCLDLPCLTISLTFQTLDGLLVAQISKTAAVPELPNSPHGPEASETKKPMFELNIRNFKLILYLQIHVYWYIILWHINK